MTDREQTLLDGRIKRIKELLGGSLPPVSPPPEPPLAEEERRHLMEAAQDLYWNELEWEKLTGEEKLDEEFLTELAFPGFLAFIRGLLLTVAMPDSPVAPRPSPEVVRDILAFLTARIVDLEERLERPGVEKDIQHATTSSSGSTHSARLQWCSFHHHRFGSTSCRLLLDRGD